MALTGITAEDLANLDARVRALEQAGATAAPPAPSGSLTKFPDPPVEHFPKGLAEMAKKDAAGAAMKRRI